MTERDTRKRVKDAVLMGIGYMAGRHNLSISKEKREKVASEMADEILGKKPKDEKLYHVRAVSSRMLSISSGKRNKNRGAKDKGKGSKK